MNSKNGAENYGHVLDDLGLKRICCRRMLLSHVEIVDDIAMYPAKTMIIDGSGTTFDAHVKNVRTISCD